MMLWQEWWVWVVGGIALAVLEVLAPGYIFLGFAIGAICTGLLIAIGLLGGSLSVLILVAAVLSLVAWYLLRRIFKLQNGDVKIWKRDINDNS